MLTKHKVYRWKRFKYECCLLGQDSSQFSLISYIEDQNFQSSITGRYYWAIKEFIVLADGHPFDPTYQCCCHGKFVPFFWSLRSDFRNVCAYIRRRYIYLYISISISTYIYILILHLKMA